MVSSSNKCHCPNGVPSTDDACPKNGDPGCSSCTGAYHLANSNRQCDANTCSCIHGAVAFGADCTAHGATKCTGCNFGYRMDGQDCVMPFEYVQPVGNTDAGMLASPVE